jgi:dethiobiotin synthetase
MSSPLVPLTATTTISQRAVSTSNGNSNEKNDDKYGDIITNPSVPTYVQDAPKTWKSFPDGSRFWKDIGGGHYQRPIFIAATRQHVGKTTTSVAIMSGLQKRFKKVGFIKPVGQQHVEVKSAQGDETLRVDKDVCLVKEHFHLDHIDYESMSPVIIPQGYTKRYVDGEISIVSQVNDILNAMENITQRSDVVLCEGTGHCAVGSIVGINNAKIASIIGADMVLVANGGLGSVRID